MDESLHRAARRRLADMLLPPMERLCKREHLTEDNRRRILALKDQYRGESCFVLGGSPSLNRQDISCLTGANVFTVNRGYMLKDRGLRHSSFHVVSDVYTFRDSNCQADRLKGFADYLFCYAGMASPLNPDQTVYFDYISPGFAEERFQSDLLQPLASYQSVIHYAIQIAGYLGFSSIYLLGVDLDFARNPGHAYAETDGETRRQLDHSVRAAQEMLDGLAACGEWLSARGVELVNLSPCGVVDCIPRRRYEDVVHALGLSGEFRIGCPRGQGYQNQ